MDWATRLLDCQKPCGYSLYQLAFDKEPIFHIEFEIKTLRTALEVGLDLKEHQTKRPQQINELDEARLLSLQHITIIQQHKEKWHESLIKKKTFQKGDWVLLYDSKFQDFLGKLQIRWLCPYEIQEVQNNGTLTLTTIDESSHSLKVNEHRVHLYHKPLTKESFC